MIYFGSDAIDEMILIKIILVDGQVNYEWTILYWQFLLKINLGKVERDG